MKKVLIYFAMAVVLALGSTSCSDFLEIEPVGAVNETNLTDQEGINYLLTGMYSALIRGQRLRTNRTSRCWRLLALRPIIPISSVNGWQYTMRWLVLIMSCIWPV